MSRVGSLCSLPAQLNSTTWLSLTFYAGTLHFSEAEHRLLRIKSQALGQDFLLPPSVPGKQAALLLDAVGHEEMNILPLIQE